VIFILAFGGLGLGMIFILIIARWAPHPNANRERTERVVGGGRPMPMEELRQLVVDILEALQMEVVICTATRAGYEIIARSTEPLKGGRFLVHVVGEVPGDLVDQPHVIHLQDGARADGVAKGILITPFSILTDGLGNLEVPLELVDGRALRDLVEKYLPVQRLEQLAKYRGFGL
jgi:hypothetical protein